MGTTTTTTSTDGGGWPWWAWFLLMLGICCFLAICCGGVAGGIFATKKKKKTEVYTGPVAYPAPQAVSSAGATTNHDDGADGDLRKPCAHGDCTGADWDGASANGNHDGASRHVHGSRRTARLLSSRLRSTLGEFRMSESDHAPSRRF